MPKPCNWQTTFDFAKEEVDSAPSSQRVIDYVFVDENCKLKVKAKSKKFYGFSTIQEFLSLVSRLDKNIDQSEMVVCSGDFFEPEPELWVVTTIYGHATSLCYNNIWLCYNNIWLCYNNIWLCLQSIFGLCYNYYPLEFYCSKASVLLY